MLKATIALRNDGQGYYIVGPEGTHLTSHDHPLPSERAARDVAKLMGIDEVRLAPSAALAEFATRPTKKKGWDLLKEYPRLASDVVKTLFPDES